MKQLPKSPPRSDDPLTEVLVNRFTQRRSFISSTRRTVQMHHQAPGPVRGQVARPIHDEFLRAWVKVALTERRRIDRVEELSKFCDTNLDNRATLRESVSSGPR